MAGSNNIISRECPKCGATNTPKGKALTVAMTCNSCGLYFCMHTTAQDKFKSSFEPAIPLGSKGTIDGKLYEVMGFAVKREKKYRYSWREYFLFNPHHGIVFLSEYGGNWNVNKPHANHPWAMTVSDEDPEVDGSTFKLYARYRCEVLYAKGEFFTDMVGVAEDSQHWEHIAPPYILMYEQSNTMIGAYLGRYADPNEIAKGFNISVDKLPKKEDRGYTQPIVGSFTPAALITLTAVAILAAFLLTLLFNGTAADKNIFQATYSREQLNEEKMFSTGSFEVEGTKNLLLNINAPLKNDWFFAEYSLINESTNEELIFTKEIEYYYGYEDGTNWSEGSKTSEAFLSSIPPGKYHINIYPDFSPNTGIFTLAVFYDTPFMSNFWMFTIGLLIFPALYFIYRHWMEVKRWKDSDYSPYETE